MRGRKPKPTALRVIEGNRGKRPLNALEPVPPNSMPTCPRHLSSPAKTEWKRIAKTLHTMEVLTMVDRAALAAYCQAWGRWVEAERKLAETPHLIKTPSGYIQQSPWLGIANRQTELMGRFMAELGITPAARSRVEVSVPAVQGPTIIQIVGADPAPSAAEIAIAPSTVALPGVLL